MVEMVILANSWRPRGVCLAGKTREGHGKSQWIRPIFSRKQYGIPVDICAYRGSAFNVGDIIQFHVSDRIPEQHQTENVLLSLEGGLSYVGCASAKELAELAQDEPASLWPRAVSTTNGLCDCVVKPPENACNDSLRWIYVSSLTISAKDEGAAYGNPNGVSVRAEFEYNQKRHKLKVKDRGAYAMFGSQATAPRCLGPHYLCISLTLPYEDGRAYKLVAGMTEAV